LQRNQFNNNVLLQDKQLWVYRQLLKGNYNLFSYRSQKEFFISEFINCIGFNKKRFLNDVVTFSKRIKYDKRFKNFR